MSERHRVIRERWADRLRASGIDIPNPFSMEAFCTHLADRRNRAIELVPMSLGAGLSGLWVPTPDSDVIVFEQATTPVHQQHIQLHEIGHLLCEHTHAGDTTALRRLLPDLDLDRLDRILARTGYRDADEHEAEWFARSVGGRTQYPSPCPPGATPEEAAMLARAARAFGSRA